MISSHGQRRIFLLPGRPDQSRNPRLQDFSTVIKQVQQSRPDVPTNPDRSCTYLFLRAHRMSKTSGWHRPWLPKGRRTSLGLDQQSKENWPGGLKIKMTLGLAKTRGKKA